MRTAGIGRGRCEGDVRVNDPIQAHVDQLGKYTDGDMHDVLAYLQTLR
jgi:hypothetical protein